MLDGVPVLRIRVLAGWEVVGSIPAPASLFMCPEQLATKKNSMLTVVIFEELKNIENRVAWFLAELCKAEKGVQKDKRNQRRTEVVRGRLAPRVKYIGNGGVVTDQAKNNKARNIIERRLALSC